MMIVESATRVAATLAAIAQNRVQLAATELEEESLRYFSYLMLSLAALFCLGVATVLGVLLLLVLYWDTHRLQILLTLIAVFGLAGVALLWWVRNQYRMKPALLAHTVNELSRDVELLEPPA